MGTNVQLLRALTDDYGNAAWLTSEAGLVHTIRQTTSEVCLPSSESDSPKIGEAGDHYRQKQRHILPGRVDCRAGVPNRVTDDPYPVTQVYPLQHRCSQKHRIIIITNGVVLGYCI